MALTITQRPVRNIPNTVDSSRWTAVENPVIYNFLRQDYTLVEIRNSAQGIRVRISGVITPEIGDVFFISEAPYKGLYRLLSFSNTATDTDLIFEATHTVDVVGVGFVNGISERFAYRIEVNVFESGTNVLLAQVEVQPFTNGIGELDLSAFLSSYLALQNLFTYQQEAEINESGSLKFYITYKEVWVGSAESEINDIAQPIFVTNSAKQIGEELGQNMGLYVPDSFQARQVPFLTKFKKPVTWEGYPFDVSFIYSDLLNSFQISKFQKRTDINGTQQATEQVANLDFQLAQKIVRLNIDNTNKQLLESFIKLIVRTGTDVFPEDQYVFSGYVENGYVAPL